MGSLSKFRWGAHHPDCRFHDHHVLRFFGHPLCLGCVCLWTGIALGLLSIVQLHTAGYSWIFMMAIGSLAIPLPFLQIKFQKKSFKIIARTGLGVGSTLFIGAPLILTPLDLSSLGIRIFIILFYTMLARFALRLRQERSVSPCDTCTLGAFPLCEWRRPEMEAAVSGSDIDDVSRQFISQVVSSLDLDPGARTVEVLTFAELEFRG
jgi:hypothetical protein